MFEGGLEFPRFVYMTREKCKSVKNLNEFEAAVNEGYIPWDDLINSERGLFAIPPHNKFTDIYKPKDPDAVAQAPVVSFGVENEKSETVGIDEPVFEKQIEMNKPKRRGRKPKAK